MDASGGLTRLLQEPLLAGGLLIAMALALATVATCSLVRRYRAGQGPASRRFCRALGLTRAERRLLQRVARIARAPGAGSLLVSRGYFETAVGLFAAAPADAHKLDAIRRKIFTG
jgi:hypothetical protein